MTTTLNESHVEAAAIEWFGELGYAFVHGPEIAPGEAAAERDSFADVVLAGRLREAVERLNPHVPAEAQEEALRKVLRIGSPALVATNGAFHAMLRDGVEVEYSRPDGTIPGDRVRLADFQDVDANDWLVVNQYTVIEGGHNRRPDIVVFVNGLPVAMLELKNAADEAATIWNAYAQLQTYKAEVPSLLHYNELLVVSDGLQARIGSLTANQEWFKVWRTITGEEDAPKGALELEVLVCGVFQRNRLLDLLAHFIVFETDPDSGATHKIIAGYHQFHAVNVAVAETVRASGMVDAAAPTSVTGDRWWNSPTTGKAGDRRAGVVWHTQGSGKSFSMLFYAGRVIRTKEKRRTLATRFKSPADPFRIVIVRDMWLTGFDAPCLHTMYADKPMQGHGLMQAIARVNRVFRDKPGGLVVDYLGLADQLKRALSTYTESGGKGNPTYDPKRAVEVMLEKYGIARDMLHGVDWSKWTTGTPAEQLGLIPEGQEAILAQEDGKARFVQVVTELSQAFALCAASDEATELRDDIAYFQAIQSALNKQAGGSRKTPEQLDAAVRQLVSKAITTEGQVIDVFTAAGLPKPDISILSDQFLAEVRGLKHKNVAAELLEKLLKDEIKLRSKRNLVQSQLFSEKLKKTLNAYHNRAIATQEVIDELIKLAKELDAAAKRGENLGLTDDEAAFYDALAVNASAVQAMGDKQLKVIAAELITQVRKSVTIDWTLRESARAKIRVMVKRILNRFGYPPDLQEEAVKTVLQQAELLCADWAAEP